MIRFSLRCSQGHSFESWFRDGASFDALEKAGHLTCPDCGSTEVSKALMAPAVLTSRKRASAPSAKPEEVVSAPAVDQLPVATAPDDKHRMFRAFLREMRDHVMQNARDVGTEFASEARRMHDGELEEAAIRGVASPDEVRSLLEDGIEVAPLPVFPDERN